MLQNSLCACLDLGMATFARHFILRIQDRRQVPVVRIGGPVSAKVNHWVHHMMHGLRSKVLSLTLNQFKFVLGLSLARTGHRSPWVHHIMAGLQYKTVSLSLTQYEFVVGQLWHAQVGLPGFTIFWLGYGLLKVLITHLEPVSSL